MVRYSGSSTGNRHTRKIHRFKVDLKLEPENGKKIAKLGEMIKVRQL